jgi:hypothetical protein
MKIISFLTFFIVSISPIIANEDHLVLVPTPITHVQDCAEHTIVKVPYVSGYALDFPSYCGKISSPYMVDVRSPSGKEKKIDINFLSQSGLTIDAKEGHNTNVHIVTLDFSTVKNDSTLANSPWSQTELLKLAIKCIYLFGDECVSQFKADIILNGINKESILHNELSKIQAERKSSQNK